MLELTFKIFEMAEHNIFLPVEIIESILICLLKIVDSGGFKTSRNRDTMLGRIGCGAGSPLFFLFPHRRRFPSSAISLGRSSYYLPAHAPVPRLTSAFAFSSPRIMSAQMFALPPARCTSRAWDSKFVSESSFSSTSRKGGAKKTGNREGASLATVI